jgi:hypothetical protein
MAYQTGTATDANDLLSKLRTFATANGWTEDNYGARTTGSGNALQIHKGGFYVTFKTDTTAGNVIDPGPFIGCYAHNTYSSGNGTEAQAGASAVTLCNGMTGSFLAYHFISNAELGAEYLYCIVETTAGIFKHFGTGTLVKIGAITNGQFVFAVRWNYSLSPGYIDIPTIFAHAVAFDAVETTTRVGPSLNVRVDADSISPRWIDGSSSVVSGRTMRGGVRTASIGHEVMMQNAASTLTGRNMIFPAFLYAERSGALFNAIGYPPGVRWCNLTYLSPNDVLTIGTDQWKVFPVIRKNGSAGQVNSSIYGYAYKVN